MLAAKLLFGSFLLWHLLGIAVDATMPDAFGTNAVACTGPCTAQE